MDIDQLNTGLDILINNLTQEIRWALLGSAAVTIHNGKQYRTIEDIDVIIDSDIVALESIFKKVNVRVKNTSRRGRTKASINIGEVEIEFLFMEGPMTIKTASGPFEIHDIDIKEFNGKKVPTVDLLSLLESKEHYREFFNKKLKMNPDPKIERKLKNTIIDISLIKKLMGVGVNYIKSMPNDSQATEARDEVDEKWEQMQIEGWREDKSDIVDFFNMFQLDISSVYDHVVSIDYDRMQVTCYLLSKIMRIIKICDFLDQLQERDNDDVDVTKIFLLISHAEIAMNNLGHKDQKVRLVKKFFSPIADKHRLQYKVKLSLSSIEPRKSAPMDFADILYKIRCEYVHEGNYTGRIFKIATDDPHADLMFNFRANGADLCANSRLTYQEFTFIYMDALVEQIKRFTGYLAS